jgi:hypothetical protein
MFCALINHRLKMIVPEISNTMVTGLYPQTI